MARVRQSMHGFFGKRAFTLVELLIVVGIVAIISIVVLLVLNPAELLRQSRDANRVTELATLDRALNIAVVDNPSINLGDPTKIYLSLPDTDPACGTYLGTGDLQEPPAGYGYACAAPADFRKPDGTGWIPINFTRLSSGVPFSSLPVDPENDAPRGLYYTYVPGGSWVLTAALESGKNLREIAAADAGSDPGRIETGSDLGLWTKALGLLGYWKFENDARDGSGNGNHGLFCEGTTAPICGGTAAYGAGKVGTALDLDGTNDFVGVAPNAALNNLGVSGVSGGESYTLEAWVFLRGSPTSLGSGIINKGPVSANGNGIGTSVTLDSANRTARVGFHGFGILSGSTKLPLNTWHHVVGVYDVGAETARIYVNGTMEASGSLGVAAPHTAAVAIGQMANNAQTLFSFLNGLIDEAKVYRRVLGDAEIRAMYTATK